MQEKQQRSPPFKSGHMQIIMRRKMVHGIRMPFRVGPLEIPRIQAPVISVGKPTEQMGTGILVTGNHCGAKDIENDRHNLYMSLLKPAANPAWDCQQQGYAQPPYCPDPHRLSPSEGSTSQRKTAKRRLLL